VALPQQLFCSIVGNRILHWARRYKSVKTYGPGADQKAKVWVNRLVNSSRLIELACINVAIRSGEVLFVHSTGGCHEKQRIYTGENYSQVFRRHPSKSLFRFAKASRRSSEGRGRSEAAVELCRKAPERFSPSEKSGGGGLSFLILVLRLPDDTLALVFQHQFSLVGSNRFLRADAKVRLRTSLRDSYFACCPPHARYGWIVGVGFGQIATQLRHASELTFKSSGRFPLCKKPRQATVS
jgi:hypothetical protein